MPDLSKKRKKKGSARGFWIIDFSVPRNPCFRENSFSPIFHLAHSVCYKYLDQSGFKRAIKDTQYIVRRSRRHLTEKLQVEVHLHSYKQHLLPWQIYKITNEINCVLIDMKSKKSSFLAWKYMLQKYLKFTKFMLTWCQLGISAHTHTHQEMQFTLFQYKQQLRKKNKMNFTVFHCLMSSDLFSCYTIFLSCVFLSHLIN